MPHAGEDSARLHWLPDAVDDFALEMLCVTANIESLSLPLPGCTASAQRQTDACGAEDAIRGAGPGTRRGLASEFAQFTGMYLRTSDPESRTQNVVAGLGNQLPIPGG